MLLAFSYRITTSSANQSAAMTPWYLSDITLWILTILIGLIGFVMAVRGLFGDRAKGRPHCWKCRYEMSHIETLTCPECGHTHRARPQLFKTRRYYKRFLLGAFLLMLALHCHTGPQVQFRRAQLGEKWWESVVPTTAWIVMLPYLEEERVVFLERRLWPPEVQSNGPAGSMSGSSGTSLTLFDDGGVDVSILDSAFDDLGWTFEFSEPLSDWQASLLASSIARYMNRTPAATSASMPGGNTSATLFYSFHRQTLAKWLNGMAKQIDVLDQQIANCSDADPDIRIEALFAIASDDRTAKTVPVLAAALKDPDPQIRMTACLSLGAMGDKASSATDALKAAIAAKWNEADAVLNRGSFNQRHERINAIALLALLRIDAKAGFEALNSGVPIFERVIHASFKILARSNLDPALVWPVAMKAALANNPHVRELLPLAGEMIKDNPVHVQVAQSLFAALRSEDRDARKNARQAMSELGDALPPLLHWAANQNDIEMVDDIVGFMMQLGEKSNGLTHKVARTMLREPERFRGTIMDMLAHTGKPSNEVIAVLREAAKSEIVATKEMASYTLELIEAE